MNVDTEINSYLSKFSEAEKELLLNIIKQFNHADVKPSLAEKIVTYNNELEEAVQQIKNGNFIHHEDVLIESNEW